MNVTTTTERAQGFDALRFMDAYEAGTVTRQETIDGFQALLDMGISWASLPASYQRDAAFLLQVRAIRPKSNKIN